MKPVCRRFLGAVLVAAVVGACAGGRASNSASDEVRVEVASVGVDQASGAHYVLLEDQKRKTALPILIGDAEARAILLNLHGIKPERPLTHDLLRSIIEKTGNHVDRVLISDLRNQTYYAKIYLDKERYTVDSRPSDAIALAIRIDAPIFVAAKLLRSPPAIKLRTLTKLPETARGIGVTVQELTPSLAKYFDPAGKGGVLVAAVGPKAQDAGIRRGDLIVKVDGHEVKSLNDFSRSLAAAKDKGTVVVAFERNGAAHRVVVKAQSSSGE